MEEVGEHVLVGPKWGYKDDLHLIAPHLAQNLQEQEQGSGWKGIAEFGGSGKEKGFFLEAWPENSSEAEEGELVVHGGHKEIPVWCVPLAKDRVEHGIMSFPFVIVIEGPAECVLQGVAGGWEVHSMEGDSVTEAPVPEVNGFHAEGVAQGTTLLVDTHNFCHVVGEQLKVQGFHKRQECLTDKADKPEIPGC